MTIEAVVRKVLLDEHADVLRAALEAVCAQLMEGEVSGLIGAELGERRPDDRMTHRAKVETVSDGGRVVNKALVIAHGVHETGRREILSIDADEPETEAFWTDFLRGLVKRSLVGAQLAISDAHAGLKAAIAKVLGCAWQRCAVHFLRDCLGHAKVATLLEDAEPDVLAFYAFSAAHWRRLRSTNPLERFNKEIGRRTDVVGSLPDDQSQIRLAGMFCIEQNDCHEGRPGRAGGPSSRAEDSALARATASTRGGARAVSRDRPGTRRAAARRPLGLAALDHTTSRDLTQSAEGTRRRYMARDRETCGRRDVYSA